LLLASLLEGGTWFAELWIIRRLRRALWVVNASAGTANAAEWNVW